MTTVNTFIYSNAFTVNGMVYDLKVTVDAEKKADGAKLIEIFKAVIGSYFNQDDINNLTLEQLRAIVTHDPDQGAAINGDPLQDQKIRDVYLATFQAPEYQGQKVAEPEPSIADAIQDMHDLQTSPQVAGDINPSGSWASWGIDKTAAAAGGLASAVGGIANAAGRVASTVKEKVTGSGFETKIKDRTNLEKAQNYFDAIAKKKKQSEEAQKFYNEVILPYIQKKIKDNGADPSNRENIRKGTLEALAKVNEQLARENRITADSVIRYL